MQITAIEYFNKWFEEELKLTKVSIPTACCLSTTGIDNYPNARIVSLKGIVDNNFVVTGPLTSRKGIEIAKTNKVALTFWWTETERQVRIQGNAMMIKEELAVKYFSERSRDSQIVSIVSDQGQKLDDIAELNRKYQEIETTFKDQPLKKPANWGGYAIEPIRMEFFEFRTSRFHERKLYEVINGQWIVTELQP
jgi:pyridoxamine 5'-phosphate oxidase